MCTFPRPMASVIPTQTPAPEGAVLPGGGCPLGTPSPAEAVCFGAGDDAPCASRSGLGAAGSAAGAAAGAGASACVLQSVTARSGGPGSSFSLFATCFTLLLRPPRQSHAGPRSQKSGLPWTVSLARCVERGQSTWEALWDRCSVLVRVSVRVQSGFCPGQQRPAKWEFHETS